MRKPNFSGENSRTAQLRLRLSKRLYFADIEPRVTLTRNISANVESVTKRHIKRGDGELTTYGIGQVARIHHQMAENGWR